MRLAVLFGSVAIGAETDRSDVDLFVVVRDGGAVPVAALAERLRERLGRDVQVVRAEDALDIPVLMVDVLEHARVLVDRDKIWPGLKAAERGWRDRAQAAENVALEDAMPDLEVGGVSSSGAPPAPL